MTVSANAVKELREKTNAPMMDCKKALEEAKGNMDGALEILRKKGAVLAQKKASRTTKEGILSCDIDPQGKSAILVEVNCETDFVVKTPDFQNFVKDITVLVKKHHPKDQQALSRLPYNGKQTVEETLTALIAKIGENIQIRNFVCWEAGAKEKIGSYLHAGNKIGSLVLLEDPEDKIVDQVRELAMHIAAMQPQYVKPSEIPADVVEKEKEILKAGADNTKPAAIQEKIVQGKLAKYFNDICLENQIFIKDPSGKQSVKDWLNKQSPKAMIKKFVRLQVGV